MPNSCSADSFTLEPVLTKAETTRFMALSHRSPRFGRLGCKQIHGTCRAFTRYCTFTSVSRMCGPDCPSAYPASRSHSRHACVQLKHTCSPVATDPYCVTLALTSDTSTARSCARSPSICFKFWVWKIQGRPYSLISQRTRVQANVSQHNPVDACQSAQTQQLMLRSRTRFLHAT
jgi:hypothetical protein